MTSKHKGKTEDKIEHIESALTKAELFVEKNQKIISGVILSLLVIVGATFAFHRYHILPRNAEATSQMFHAEQYFDSDSLRLALNGDGNNLGFLDIIDEYGSTKAGNLAQYYAGISYLQLGEFENALEHLKKFRSKDLIVSNIALGAMGDAYAELGQTSEAITYYLKAAKHVENDQTSPIYLFRAGLLYEETSEYSKAIDTYNQILKDFPTSAEGRQIEKYITRAKIKGNIQ